MADPSQDDVRAAAARITGQAVAGTLNRKIALGIHPFNDISTDAWVVVKPNEGIASEVDVVFVAHLNDAHTALAVDVALLAPSGVWEDIGLRGETAVARAAENLSFDIEGKLAYYVRHLRSIIVLMTQFAAVLAVVRNLAPGADGTPGHDTEKI